VLSTGEVIANPRHLEVALKELRRLQRQACRRAGPDKRTRGVATVTGPPGGATAPRSAAPAANPFSAKGISCASRSGPDIPPASQVATAASSGIDSPTPISP
jgi:hypothetical protein